MAELLLGCGSSRVKKLSHPDRREWNGLVTLDFHPAHKPDVLHDMRLLPLPFPDSSFEEIHAYDTMEHVGAQGDWRFFFNQWSDIWRILQPDGLFFGRSPHWSSPWSWMDPGHTRAMGPEMLIFLDQTQYAQVGRTPMTDYRFCYKADFDVVHTRIDENRDFEWIMRAVKPARTIDG